MSWAAAHHGPDVCSVCMWFRAQPDSWAEFIREFGALFLGFPSLPSSCGCPYLSPLGFQTEDDVSVGHLSTPQNPDFSPKPPNPHPHTMPLLYSECHLPCRICLFCSLSSVQCLWIFVFWYFVGPSCYWRKVRPLGPTWSWAQGAWGLGGDILMPPLLLSPRQGPAMKEEY